MKHALGYTRNKTSVFVDLIQSRAAVSIAQKPILLEFIKEALERTVAKGAEVTIQHDMGRIIGHSFVVETTDADSIMYAKLAREDVYTRFVKNGKAVSTSYLTFLLQKSDLQGYELVDAWIGPEYPPRPGSGKETAESMAYWNTHAYLLDRHPLQVRSITRVCPY